MCSQNSPGYTLSVNYVSSQRLPKDQSRLVHCFLRSRVSLRNVEASLGNLGLRVWWAYGGQGWGDSVVLTVLFCNVVERPGRVAIAFTVLPVLSAPLTGFQTNLPFCNVCVWRVYYLVLSVHSSTTGLRDNKVFFASFQETDVRTEFQKFYLL